MSDPHRDVDARAPIGEREHREIGRELDARYIVDGSVRKFADQVRINTQLIDAGTRLPVMGAGMALIDALSGEFVRGTGADGNGEYWFAGLAPGQYKVLAEGPPEGYTPELYGGVHCPWPCSPEGEGTVITIDSVDDVESGIDIELDFEGTRIVGRITRSDTEEPVNGTFAQSVAARIQENCFEYLDAPVRTIGAENMPAIPLNSILEKTMLLSAEKVGQAMEAMLAY